MAAPLALIGLGLVALGVALAPSRGRRVFAAGDTAVDASSRGYSEHPANPCIRFVRPLRLNVKDS